MISPRPSRMKAKVTERIGNQSKHDFCIRLPTCHNNGSHKRTVISIPQERPSPFLLFCSLSYARFAAPCLQPLRPLAQRRHFRRRARRGSLGVDQEQGPQRRRQRRRLLPERQHQTHGQQRGPKQERTLGRGGSDQTGAPVGGDQGSAGGISVGKSGGTRWYTNGLSPDWRRDPADAADRCRPIEDTVVGIVLVAVVFVLVFLFVFVLVRGLVFVQRRDGPGGTSTAADQRGRPGSVVTDAVSTHNEHNERLHESRRADARPEGPYAQDSGVQFPATEVDARLVWFLRAPPPEGRAAIERPDEAAGQHGVFVQRGHAFATRLPLPYLE